MEPGKTTPWWWWGDALQPNRQMKDISSLLSFRQLSSAVWAVMAFIQPFKVKPHASSTKKRLVNVWLYNHTNLSSKISGVYSPPPPPGVFKYWWSVENRTLKLYWMLSVNYNVPLITPSTSLNNNRLSVNVSVL